MNSSVKTYASIIALFLFLLSISAKAKNESTVNKTSTQSFQPTVSLAKDPLFGRVIVDNEGRTLYFFSKDYDGTSACNGDCAGTWPPYYEEDIAFQDGLNPEDFGVIFREDGSKQTTFRDWPLYYFAGDVQIGDINGDGLGNVWFVAKPDYRVMVATQEVDGKELTYLVDCHGYTLYHFTVDDDNFSNCKEDCEEAWPPFYNTWESFPSILNKAEFGSFNRGEEITQVVEVSGSGGGCSGRRRKRVIASQPANPTIIEQQSTFKSQPMYFFAKDNVRGEIRGHGASNVWFVFENE